LEHFRIDPAVFGILPLDFGQIILLLSIVHAPALLPSVNPFGEGEVVEQPASLRELPKHLSLLWRRKYADFLSQLHRRAPMADIPKDCYVTLGGSPKVLSISGCKTVQMAPETVF